MSTTSTDDQNQAPSDSSGLGDAGKKALQAERARADQAEKDAREAKAALQAATVDHEKKITDLTTAHETAVQALQQQVAEATETANRAGVDRDRVQAAYQVGLPADLVEFLRGENLEELTKSAETLKTHTSAGANPSGLVPDPSQGAAGSSGPVSTADLFASTFQST